MVNIHRESHWMTFILYNEVYQVLNGLVKDESDLDNICPLFWWSLFTFVFVTAVYTAAISGILAFFVMPFDIFGGNYFDPLLDNFIIGGHYLLAVLLTIGMVAAFASLVFITLILVSVMVSWLTERFSNWRSRRRQLRRQRKLYRAKQNGTIPEPNIIKMKYRAWREKTCVPVDYV